MTVKDMHIEVNQSLQKVAANTTRKFISEEIDWILNKMMHRFVQLKVKVKKEGNIDELGADSLRNLVVTGYSISTVVDNTERVKAVLPGDYMYLISDTSTVLKSCNNEYFEESDSTVYTSIPIIKSNLSNAPYYLSASLTIGSTTISLSSSLDAFANYSGLSSKDDVMIVVDFLVGKFRDLGFNLYYNSLDNIKRPHSIIFQGNAGSLTIDGITSNGANITKPYTIAVAKRDPITTKATNRLQASENVQNLMSTEFWTTTDQSPLSELSNGTLLVYRNNSFTVTNVDISYIRKPKIISLALGQDCEIAEEFHQTICDLTVEYLKGRLNDPAGTQLAEQDINNRVIL